MTTESPPRATTRLSIFPLPGALLFPGMHLPLHMFEPRYRAMISDAMARDRRIGMIQPRGGANDDGDALYDIGCVGKIAEVEALDDGRYNVVLEGIAVPDRPRARRDDRVPAGRGRAAAFA